MNHTLKILIVGGYGTFGGRLVELLENEPRLTLVVTGRSVDKARTFCSSRTNAQSVLIPAHFDRAGDLSSQLTDIRPDIVVDASGPFQNYGKDAYRLVEACIARNIHYLDLADGSDFVQGISAYDDAARAAGVFVLSGVSSFPVLTAAVARHLSRDMTDIHAIKGGIAPSPYAGVGGNVIRAIAGYAGQKKTLVRNGRTETAWPLTDSMRYTIAPPGRLPLKNTLFSLVDVPDLDVLSDLYPKAKTIWMGAGPVPEILHRALNGFAWLVRWKIVPSLLPLAGLMEWATNHLRWGEHRGGMFVEVTGTDSQGKQSVKSWHLLAEGRDGPLIPSMAVESIVRKILSGKTIQPGARTALNEISLEDYVALFSARTIYAGIRDDRPDTAAPLYQRIPGSAWNDLPIEIRSMHEIHDHAVAEGTATIERGNNLLGQLACLILGFPKTGKNIPVSVNFSVRNGRETWTRNFAGQSFSSVQYEGRGKNARLLVERFGMLSFGMALVHTDGRLNLVLRRWSFLGAPLPMWLCPRSDSYEYVSGHCFHFNVRIFHPLTGLIVHYKGELPHKA